MSLFPSAQRPLCLAVLWTLACLAVPALAARAGDDAPPPVSTSELCLLLRGGCTDAEILGDTAGRPLLEPLDAGAEKLLRDAGAGQGLIDTLRRSRPVATRAQAEAEHARQEALAEQHVAAWEANQARLREASQAALQASLATRAQEALQNVARLLRGKLLVYRDQRLQNYDDSRLSDKKQFAFYVAALADPACRKFTPQLVKFYERYAPAHPELELVFISKDYSSLEMESDVRAYAMPWPVVDYPRLSEDKNLSQLGGALPRLLVVDGAGRKVVDSFEDGQYVGPQHVLDVLTHNAESSVAANH